MAAFKKFLHPSPLMLLRIAQADATAMAVEYVKRTAPNYEELLANVLAYDRFCQHPKHVSLRPGQYTDDTQMSIGVAEVLLRGKPYHVAEFAEAWVRCFHRDQRDGYSRNFQQFLESTFTGTEFLRKIQPTSTKNGAGMRAMCLGFIPSAEEVAAIALMQAAITHNTPEGIFCAQAAALMAHFAMYTDVPFDSMSKLITPHLQTPEWFPDVPYLQPWEKDNDHTIVKGVARKTIRGVYTALTTCSSMMEMLTQIIKAGGDTDSVAAITWGIAACRFPHEAVPAFMEYALEPGGKYGAEFLKNLGQQLHERFS